MPARTRRPSDGQVLLMVGTVKGAFIFTSGAKRSRWTMHGPHFSGESVYALAYDERGGRRRLLASTRSFHWGSTIRTSDDFGATWSGPERQTVRFPEASGLSLVQVWQIKPGPPDSPDLLWAGVEPTALFESRDGGDSWSAVEALLAHEHRPRWTPGGGGMCLHTIVPDPNNRARMLIAMSTGGVYRTDDGGKSWRARNVGVRAQFLPNKYPEFGQCVHKVVHHPKRPERLFLQNHWGLYRSDDWGDSWTDVANGVPSDFGFTMQMHPHDPDTVYIVPLQSDEFRCTPEAKLRVYRTRNAGDSWEALSNGLPQKDAYETVVRDAMSADAHDPAGVYFGTRSGKLFASADGGDSWSRVADSLPPVVCVRAAVVGVGSGGAADLRVPIAVVLPRALYPYSRGSSTLTLDDPCSTVADALSAIGSRWPGVLDRVMTEQGAVREHVNIFVGEESIRFADGLATPVGDGDTIMIVAAVSGG